jgi:pilus assembly protein Flp/PilA
MTQFKQIIQLLKDRAGATMIEYALIGGIICVGIIAGATAVGGSTSETFNDVSEGVWGIDAG